MWTVYFQEDDSLRYEIAVTKFKHTAVFERDEFIKRMTHPAIGTWWCWVERDENENDFMTRS